MKAGFLLRGARGRIRYLGTALGFEGAAILRGYAHRMRKYPTQSEARLWWAIRASQLGVAFRRQVVVRGFIVDFLARSALLIVEVDGSYHSNRAVLDAQRDLELQRAGYRVLRIEAALVMKDLPAALRRITGALKLVDAPP